ncbi:sensor histidine kinase [Castellaniella sp.]|uniref:sensor histidine kinase n=1 Tax=Castellaniella sp. TaxID=1955812 RepID=UPI003C721D7D
MNRRRAVLAGAWCLLVVLTAVAVALWQWQVQRQRFVQESTALLRQASQLVGQHDAHLTTLSAVALAPDDPDHHLFLEVAQSVRRYYPRIREIWLVPLAGPLRAVGLGAPDQAVWAAVRHAALGSTGQPALIPYPGRSDGYLLVKRSPNTAEARYGLALGVDTAQLIQGNDGYWDQDRAAKRLMLPGGRTPDELRGGWLNLHFSQELGSASQALVLDTAFRIQPAALLDPAVLALAVLLVSAVGAGLALIRQSRARARAALEQARISALDSRLAHAHRVNAMGEMASGLAHELTQPLTSILALAQAGRRLLAQGDPVRATQALDDVVVQAKRGAALLERFRHWSRPRSQPPAVVDVRRVLDHVHTLLASELAAHRVRLRIQAPDEPVGIRADAVQMEQVVFNLLRNALDAVGALENEAHIEVTLSQRNGRVILLIRDNGPGVPEPLRAQLFSPFVTGREGGTGLGLALCRRLVERVDGEITLVDDGAAAGACFRVEWPACPFPGRSEGDD